MQHTIVTLEVQLLVKDIVDAACVRAAERASERERSSERFDDLSLKVSTPAGCAPDPTAVLSIVLIVAKPSVARGRLPVC